MKISDIRLAKINVPLRVPLNTALPVKAAALCDMLEQPEQELAAGAGVQLHAGPFEVITLRLKV